jgi:hypothetical protein
MVLPQVERNMSDEVPFLFKISRFQGVYQNLEEQDEEGNIIPLKMQASKEFKTKFNELVYNLLIDCVDSARREGRKMMVPEDVPNLQDVPDA